MTQHNKTIFDLLHDYMSIMNPGYAVFLKGSWGCGKTYFIKQWIETLKEQADDEEGITLKPVYVSLYGLASASQIDEAVRRAISPWLHGKLAKGGQKLLKMIASAALRYNVDFNGDGKQDQMVCTIDPKALLGNENGAVKGDRLIIFDDLERCLMEPQDTLGYINYYVEHAGSHVIILGDDDKIDDEKFLNIKEKTIGREFAIETETDEAIAAFVREADRDGVLKLSEQVTLIRFCFETARYNNLRTLRQSLNDYKLFVSRLSEDIKNLEGWSNVCYVLLANFIIVYAEYKAGVSILADFQTQLTVESVSRLMKGNGEAKVRPASNLQAKYEKSGLTESHKVLQNGYVEVVMNYLQYGVVGDEFLRIEINRERNTTWELLGNYLELSNEEVDKNVGLTAGYMEQASFDSVDQLLLATCNMLTVLKKGLSRKSGIGEVISWCLSGLDKKYFSCATNLEDLYHKRGHVIRCLGYYAGESTKDEIKTLSAEIEKLFQQMPLRKRMH